tara:strand:- start:412 stop:939 length:528 start_codon:yes stop_codon:yes gene_type:complete
MYFTILKKFRKNRYKGVFVKDLNLEQKKKILQFIFKEVASINPDLEDTLYKEIDLSPPFLEAFIEEGPDDSIQVFFILQNSGKILGEEVENIHTKGSPDGDRVSELINISLNSDIIEGVVRMVGEEDNPDCSSWIEAGFIVQTHLGMPEEDEIKAILEKTMKSSKKLNDSFEEEH